MMYLYLIDKLFYNKLMAYLANPLPEDMDDE